MHAFVRVCGVSMYVCECSAVSCMCAVCVMCAFDVYIHSVCVHVCVRACCVHPYLRKRACMCLCEIQCCFYQS